MGMMNRRWFFTAAGSAFFAASCTAMRNGFCEPRECSTTTVPDAEEQWCCLIEHFFKGLERERTRILEKNANVTDDQFPRTRQKLQMRFENELAKIYRPRFDWRIEKGDLEDRLYEERLNQACVLGQLTAISFEFQSGVTGDPDALSFRKRPEVGVVVVLGLEHLEWARDMYGFYTNSKIIKKKNIDLCGGRQIDQACPFCAA